MSQSLYTAAVGMRAQQQRIDTMANNVANVNTNGFKKSRVDFKDAMYQAMQNPTLPAGDETMNLQLGQGLLIDSETKVFSDGALLETGRALDLALSGEGFFALENPEGGAPLYTRDGVFQSQEQADGSFALTTAGGYYVLNTEGQRVEAPVSFEQMSVNENGQITAGGLYVAQLGRFSFVNAQGLEAVGSKTWEATAQAGEPQAAETQIRQGYMEGSNVDLSEEMTRLIRAQRAFSLLSRAITTADQMKATENDLRR